MSAQEHAAATTTTSGQGAAIPTVIQCNPTGTSPPAGMRLTYFTERSVDEVTAQLAQGSQPMLVGCTSDTINLLVKVRQAHTWQAVCSHLLTVRLFSLDSARCTDTAHRFPCASPARAGA